ncbi:hypothetical protein BU34_22950 [Escherichia coli]|nr:hypothetical protein BU34_22950 [Escherichia coli]
MALIAGIPSSSACLRSSAHTHHAFSSGAGRTSDGNGSHASTLKSPSYTKSVSWQHYLRNGLRMLDF